MNKKKEKRRVEELLEALNRALNYIETVTWNAEERDQEETAAIRAAIGKKPSP